MTQPTLDQAPLVFILARELDALLEYSTSIPTGTAAGKRWKRRIGARWYLGAYYTSPQLEAEELTGIAWFEVCVVDTPLARSQWLDRWVGQGDPRRFVGGSGCQAGRSP